MAVRKRYIYRYLLIALVFCMVCVIYVGRLFYIQIAGRGTVRDDGTVETKVKIQAVRGEILDRHGETLVANDYAYTLTVQFSSISSVGVSGANRTYLRLLEALESQGFGDAHEEPYFPFLGTYPDYVFSPQSQDPDSPVSYRLGRLLQTKGMEADASVEELVAELHLNHLLKRAVLN